MTPFILLALFGFGLAAFAGTTDTEIEGGSDQLPEEPQEPQMPDTTGLNTSGFTVGMLPDSGITQTSGTDADDLIQVDEGQSVEGRGGNDLLIGADSNETLFGNESNDTIIAGAGNDFALGHGGDDLLFLGDGDDESTSFNRDHIGDDTIIGGAGNDVLHDTRGSNQIFGGAGNDNLAGTDSDQLYDQQTYPDISHEELRTPDFLNGGAGNDLIVAQDGDTVVTGLGADSLNLRTNLDVEEALITVEDFNTDEDVLGISVRVGQFGIYMANDDQPTFIEDPQAGGLTVLLRDEPIALLRGLTATDIDSINVVNIDQR